MKYLLVVFLVISANTIYGQSANDLLLIKEESGYGYINREGKVVIEPNYPLAMDFADRRAFVMLSRKPRHEIFINVKGKTVFEMEKDKDPFPWFSNGLLRVEKWGMNDKTVYYLDTMGAIVIKKRVREAMEFQCGLARITGFNGLDGYINKKDILVHDTIYTKTWRFSEGYTTAYDTKDSTWVILDTAGNASKIKGFMEIKPFSGGLAAMRLGTGWGYINTKGERIIPFIYEEAYNFSEGLAAVNYKGAIGYIDTSGKMIIEPQFDLAEEFHDGVAPVENIYDRIIMGHQYTAFIDKAGKILFTGNFYTPSYEGGGIWKYYEGYHFTGRIRYITSQGKQIW